MDRRAVRDRNVWRKREGLSNQGLYEVYLTRVSMRSI